MGEKRRLELGAYLKFKNCGDGLQEESTAVGRRFSHGTWEMGTTGNGREGMVSFHLFNI
jgi:hypothetical protein